MIKIYILMSKDPVTLMDTGKEIVLSGAEKVKLEIERRLVIGDTTYAPLFNYNTSGNKFITGVYEVIDHDK